MFRYCWKLDKTLHPPPPPPPQINPTIARIPFSIRVWAYALENKLTLSLGGIPTRIIDILDTLSEV